jgi:hypothetical protein
MATYAELITASQSGVLTDKIKVACFVAAETVRTENTGTTNHANRLLWAKNVFADPEREAKRMVWAVLAQNKSATLAQITGASDATVQTAVDAAVDDFANGAA